MANNRPSSGASKPARKPKTNTFAHLKPRKNFPLSAHPSGWWQKKIAGKLHYFGKWGRRVNGVMEPLPGNGAAEAEAAYKAFISGQTPDNDGTTVKELCNHFLTAMHKRLQTGRKMTARSFEEYRTVCERMCAAFGKNVLVTSLKPIDFSNYRNDLAMNYGVHRQGNEVQKIRTIFKWGLDNEHIPKAPRYSSDFKKPDRTEIRLHKAKRGKKLLTRSEIHQLIAATTPELAAMILLGVNCGLGNKDVALLPLSAVDLDKNWIDFPRPKTGIDRRCALWPETVTALRTVIAQRPRPKPEAQGLVFLRKDGSCWVTEEQAKADSESDVGFAKLHHRDAVGSNFGKLLRRLKINGRNALGFYSLRHTFRTVADGSLDFPAVRLIMGHVDNSIDAEYRAQIDDSRLVKVTEVVRAWLFGTEGGAQ